jgi:hypothetical protein
LGLELPDPLNLLDRHECDPPISWLLLDLCSRSTAPEINGWSGILLASADDHVDLEAAAPDRPRPRALAEDATDAP